MTKAELLTELNTDKFDVPNFNRLRDFLEHLINGLGVGGEQTLIKVGSITFAELNTGAAVASFTKTIVGGIPADKYMVGAFAKTKTAFSSTTLVNLTSARAANAAHVGIIDAVGSTVYDFNKNSPPAKIKGLAADFEAIVDLSANNANDFLTGEIEFWAILSDYPSLV